MVVSSRHVPVFQLPVLAGIVPAGLQRKVATLALARTPVKHDWNILHDTTNNELCLHANSSPVTLTIGRHMRCYVSSLRTVRRMDCGSVEAGVGSTRTHLSTPPRIGPKSRYQGERSESKTLDDSEQTANWGRLVHYSDSMKKWGLTGSAACECGEPEQTAG